MSRCGCQAGCGKSTAAGPRDMGVARHSVHTLREAAVVHKSNGRARLGVLTPRIPHFLNGRAILPKFHGPQRRPKAGCGVLIPGAMV